MNSPIGQALQIIILSFVLLMSIIAIGMAAIALGTLDNVPISILVILAGAAGGVGNNFRRLQKLSMHDWHELDSTTRWLMTLQIYASPIIGGLFAYVLYFAFEASVIQGSMFPEFSIDDSYKNLDTYASKLRPKTNGDASKVFFWSFVAGFAEALVPNIIDKVAKQAEQATAPTES
jgi:phosphate/sulfate permease